IKSLSVEVRLQTEVTPALVEQIKPDAVIVAVGGKFVKPQVPGITRDNVFSAQDLLNLMNGISINKGFLFNSFLPLARKAINAATVRTVLSSNFPIKKNVAVIGGQFPGSSLALFLAEKGKKVTVIEEAATFGNDIEQNVMTCLKDEIEAGNVKVLTSTKVKEITDKGVVVIDSQGNESLQEVDSVIVAMELAPSDSKLAEDLKGKVKEVYKIGDARSFGRIKRAINEGFTTAYNL
ncbi:MAG: FAD-dependent oxidoreductase, partial [Dehalococcoidales bacterium]|nr:FAD-dependent oxidoreductase [Dehalococcoidales bacterium]